MTKPNFQSMSHAELRDYLKNNRKDQEAFEAYMDKLATEPVLAVHSSSDPEDLADVIARINKERHDKRLSSMNNQPGLISQFNTGSMGGGMQAFVGNNNEQNMTIGKTQQEDLVTTFEVIQKLTELQQIIENLDISNKNKLQRYVNEAKKEAEDKEPNKKIMKLHLEEVANNLQQASKTFESGEKFWNKVKPIFKRIGLWLGSLATDSFWNNL